LENFLKKPPPSTHELFGIAIGDCARIWRNKVNDRLRPLGLSQATWIALWNLSWFPDGLSQSELAERLGIEGPTLVKLIDKLQVEGLVERHPSLMDRRRKIVKLTERAGPILLDVKTTIAILRQEIMTSFPEQRIEEGLALLTQIRDKLIYA
jgi:MarR family transcriptional regulator for hemolysin